ARTIRLVEADGRLDQLGESPYPRPAALKGFTGQDRCQRIVVAAKAVVERPAQELGDRQREPLPARLGFDDDSPDKLCEFVFATAQSGKRKPAARNRGDSRHFSRCPQLFLEELGLLEFADERENTASITESEREGGQL